MLFADTAQGLTLPMGLVDRKGQAMVPVIRVPLGLEKSFMYYVAMSSPASSMY